MGRDLLYLSEDEPRCFTAALESGDSELRDYYCGLLNKSLQNQKALLT